MGELCTSAVHGGVVRKGLPFLAICNIIQEKTDQRLTRFAENDVISPGVQSSIRS
jgi:hypothetical protein